MCHRPLDPDIDEPGPYLDDLDDDWEDDEDWDDDLDRTLYDEDDWDDNLSYPNEFDPMNQGY